MAALTTALDEAFSWVLQTSLHAGLLAGLVALALAAARGRIAPRWRHALWLLVALRLCLPVAPPSPLAFARLLPGPAVQPAPGEPVGIRYGSPASPAAAATPGPLPGRAPAGA